MGPGAGSTGRSGGTGRPVDLRVCGTPRRRRRSRGVRAGDDAGCPGTGRTIPGSCHSALSAGPAIMTTRVEPTGPGGVPAPARRPARPSGTPVPAVGRKITGLADGAAPSAPLSARPTVDPSCAGGSGESRIRRRGMRRPQSGSSPTRGFGAGCAPPQQGGFARPAGLPDEAREPRRRVREACPAGEQRAPPRSGYGPRACA